MLASAALTELLPALQQRLRSAVHAEQAHEAAALRALYSGSVKRLQKDGAVLLGLQAVPHTVLYSSMVWKFTVGPSPSGRGGRRELPYHRFRQGDSLLVTRWSNAPGEQVRVHCAARSAARAL